MDVVIHVDINPPPPLSYYGRGWGMEGGVNKVDFSGQMFQNLKFVKVTLDTNVINSSISPPSLLYYRQFSADI